MKPDFTLLRDLKRRHGPGTKVGVPFLLGDEVLVVDLLSERSSDVAPRRALAVDPTGKWTIKVSTCYPDPDGVCNTPVLVHEKAEWDGHTVNRWHHIRAMYEVTPELVAALKEKKLILEKLKGLGPNEWGLNFLHADVETFRMKHPDLEYKAEPADKRKCDFGA